MAENVREIPEQPKNSVDKEVRLRAVKDRQNEERQRKLEEIKAQALAAQRFKEQKEQERKKRLDEMRLKDDTRRHQVEERKRAINEAERDRLESILRRNKEREARIEAKKRNERSSIVFAFGSSTPRMLDPTDVTVSFWGHRRATSTQNITTTASAGSSLTRRQSERDLDAGSKKRATSAGGLERAGESLTSPTTPAGCASGYLGRRRTDLVPTIPSRDSSFHSSTSRKSLNHSPGRAYSMSRLDQLAKPRKPLLPALNESNMAPKSSVTRSMSHLAHVGTKMTSRKPLGKADSRSMHQLSPEGPVAPPRVNRATQLRQQKLLMAQQSTSTSEASSRPSSSLSQQSTNSVTRSDNVRHRISSTPRRPRPASIAVTGVTHDVKSSIDRGENKPPLPKTRKSLSKTNTSEKIEKGLPKNKTAKSPSEETAPKIVGEDKKEHKDERKAEDQAQKGAKNDVPPSEPVPANEPAAPPAVAEEKEAPVHKVQEEEAPKPQESKVVEIPPQLPQQQPQEATREENVIQNFINTERNASDVVSQVQTSESVTQSQTTTAVSSSSVVESKEVKQDSSESSEMTASMTKPRITTEEEAKAALAERRRLIREEAERQAELERQRIEAEQRAEFERQQREEEQARLLAEMQRRAEEERLQEAIREAQRREEEERLRREEEQRQKQLKEEAERKAKEEAERQKVELQKKLENEEKEREERRRRVEMIMSRTRGKANANLSSQQNSQDKNENTSDNKQQADENKLNEENKVNENKLNGTKQENGTSESSTTKNGKDVDVGIVDNIIPDESVKNANTVADTINADSLNSNSTWQASSQQFLDVS